MTNNNPLKQSSNTKQAPPPSAPITMPNVALGKKLKKNSGLRGGPGCLKRLFGFLGLLFGLALIVSFLGVLKYSTLFLAPEEESRELIVRIPDGSSASQIGQILENAGVIKSQKVFIWSVKAKNKFKGPVLLKAGEMALDPSLNIWETIDLLEKGNYKLYPFTIPEGRNIYEIAKKVEEFGLGSASDFLALCRDRAFIASLGLDVDNLEGYLFPDTYNFPKGTSLKLIIKTMTDSFFKIWRKYENLANQKGLTRDDVVILASIVEKETGVGHERPVIAGVFFNRLAKGMRLQTDPTVIYGFLPDFEGSITRKHLQTNHPYNTYVIPGLPPGPITNPGEASISAVVTPSVVPYYYFVSKNDGSGSHDFSENLTEHNRKVNRYLRQKTSPVGRR